MLFSTCDALGGRKSEMRQPLRHLSGGIDEVTVFEPLNTSDSFDKPPLAEVSQKEKPASSEYFLKAPKMLNEESTMRTSVLECFDRSP